MKKKNLKESNVSLTPEMQEAVKDIVKGIIANPEPKAPEVSAEELEKAKKAKDEDDDKESKKKDSKKDDKDKDDKDDKKPNFMKKSEEGTSNESKETKTEDNGIGQLSAEEVALVKAWRASEDANEPITKAQEPKQDEELKKALEAEKTEKEALKKSIEDQSTLIKSLTEKVEKMANQPAYDKKAVTSLEPIEKSQPETEKASKKQVLNALLELQQEGEATSHDVSKYEATNQLSKSLQEKVKTKIVKGK